jgi:dihydroflavonol-4-reductase
VSDAAFVTGGSGFVGGAILQQLAGNGREVHALARSDEAADRVRSIGGIPVRGDVLDEPGLRDAIAGCVTVFHAAGVNSLCTRDTAALERTNVDGTVAVVRAAAHAGAARVVLTSSAATMGERPGAVGHEQTPHRGWFLSPYDRSKTLAEREALRVAQEVGIELVCVNPSSVQGPGRTGGTAKLLLRAANADRIALVDTVVSFVDVQDCVAGHLLAETHGLPGHRYVLNGASLPVRDVVAMVREHTGGPRRVTWLPRWVVAGAAVPLSAAAGLLTRREPPVCPAMLRTLLHGHRYDGSRATRDLGLRYTPIEDTIARSIDWYRDHGLMPAP